MNREDEALAMRVKYIATADAALAQKNGIYPGTGGREKDPYKLAKVVETQFDLAGVYSTDILLTPPLKPSIYSTTSVLLHLPIHLPTYLPTYLSTLLCITYLQ